MRIFRVPCQFKLHNKDNPTCELIVPVPETLELLCPHDVLLEREVIVTRGKQYSFEEKIADATLADELKAV